MRKRMRRLFDHAFRQGVLCALNLAERIGCDELSSLDDIMTASIAEMKRTTSGLLAEFDRSAAPELLAACEAFVEAWEKSHQLEKTDVAYRMAVDALARARADSEEQA